MKGSVFLIAVVFLLFLSCKDQENVEPEPSGKTITKLVDLDSYILQTSLDPVQNRLYFAVPNNNGFSEVYLFDLVSQNLEFKVAVDGQVSYIAITNDESYMALSIINHKIYLTNFLTNETQTFIESNNTVIALEFSPDKEFFLFGEYDNEGLLSICKINLLTNEIENLVAGNIHYVGLTYENSLLISDASQEFYIIDWNGDQIGSRIAELIPGVISEDGTMALCKKFDRRGSRIYSYNILTNMIESYIFMEENSMKLEGYSVDKNTILFRTNRDNPGSYRTELYIIDKLGETFERLTYDSQYDEEVVGFYDNDTKVLFTTDKDGNTGFYSIDLN